MMSLLEKRANFLMAGKFEKANEVEDQMTELKNTKYDELTTPKAFYCTFHQEYAYIKALFIVNFMFEGDDIKVKQATEPTDIVWENRHISSCGRKMRWVIAIILMTLCTFAAFTFLLWLIKKKLMIQFMKTPPGLDCVVVD